MIFKATIKASNYYHTIIWSPFNTGFLFCYIFLCSSKHQVGQILHFSPHITTSLPHAPLWYDLFESVLHLTGVANMYIPLGWKCMLDVSWNLAAHHDRPRITCTDCWLHQGAQLRGKMGTNGQFNVLTWLCAPWTASVPKAGLLQIYTKGIIWTNGVGSGLDNLRYHSRFFGNC